MSSKRSKIPSKKELEKDIKSLTNQDVAAKYGVSATTVSRWLHSYNLHKVNNNRKQNEEETKEAEKEAEQTPEDFYKEERKRYFSVMSSKHLDRISLVGIEVCRDVSRKISTASQEIINNTVKEAVTKEFGDRLREDAIFQVSADRLYLILPDEEFSDAWLMKDVRYDLMNGHNICIVYYARKGAFYESAEAMTNVIDEKLEALREDAIHAGSNIHDGKAYEETSVQEEESAPLTAPIQMDIDDVPDDEPEGDDESVEDVLLSRLNSTDNVEIADYTLSEAESTVPDENSTEKSTDTDTADDEESETEEIPASALPSLSDDESADDSDIEVCIVDSENVNSSWKALLSDDMNKKTVILYTDNTPKMSYDDVAEIAKHPAGLEFIKVFSGGKDSQALDLQLVSILGYMVSEHPKRTYKIISRDAGYDAAVKFWTDKGYRVCRIPMLNRELPKGMIPFAALSDEEKSEKKDACTNELEKSFHVPSAPTERVSGGRKFDRMSFLERTIPGVKKKIYEEMFSILDQRADDRGHIHADFVDIFGGANGERMYKKIRNHISEFYEI